jgi:CPA2 family monovalent cation:H+ antiporter-2
MIILKAYEEYELKKEKFAQTVLGTLVIEDIAGIFMLIILTTISVSKNISGFALVTELGLLIIFLVIWLLVGIFLIPTVLKKIDKMLNDELLLIFALAICLGMVMIANAIGFSSALGAFMAGSILAGTVKSERIEHLVKPIKDLFGAVFFVSVGMLIQPALLVKYIVPILIISVATMFGQMIFSTVGMLLSGQSMKTAVKGGCSMVQIGEFSFIVATLGMNLGVIGEYLYPIVVCVSVITSFTTPVFIKNSDNIYGFWNKVLPASVKNFIKKNTSETRIKDDKDTDWKIYLKRISIRTSICSLMMFFIYSVGMKFIRPELRELIGLEKGDIVVTLLMLVVMVPFVSLMHGTNRVYYTKLWLKNRANRLPLLTFTFIRIIIAAIFMSTVVWQIWRIPFAALMFVAVVVVVFIVKSDYAKGMAKGLEMSFVANFYEKTLDTRKKELHAEGERWLDETLQVVKFTITEDVYDYTVKKIGRHRHVHIGIIRILRDDKIYNMPPGNFELQKGDEIHAMGTVHEIEATLLLFGAKSHIERIGNKVPLKKYIYSQEEMGIPEERNLVCVPILVRDDMSLARTSIKNSRFRDKYRGSVFGIERENLPITHPSIATILIPGDIVWIIGSMSMINKLIRDNLIDVSG